VENQPAQEPAQQPAPPARRLTGVAMMLASAASNQFGAAVGAGAFATIGPLGVVAVRQFVGAAVLMTTVRPPLRRFTRRQWWPVIVLGGVFVVMNLSLYTAVDRIGLGLAVTLEFLGPLGVALAASRRLVDVGAAIAALVGVYVLVMPGPSSDVWGIASGLLAGACWASYILLSRLIGQRTEGLQGAAASSAVAAAMSLPVIVIFAVQGLFTVPALLAAAVAGLLCTVVPYALDLLALRFVPAAAFGVFMSVNPVLAAVAGCVVLAQVPAAHEWLGVAIVVAVNVWVTVRRSRGAAAV
jgi:inner membrane transporter RhtA